MICAIVRRKLLKIDSQVCPGSKAASGFAPLARAWAPPSPGGLFQGQKSTGLSVLTPCACSSPNHPSGD